MSLRISSGDQPASYMLVLAARMWMVCCVRAECVTAEGVPAGAVEQWCLVGGAGRGGGVVGRRRELQGACMAWQGVAACCAVASPPLLGIKSRGPSSSMRDKHELQVVTA
jgi:hypothetical protein